MMNSDRYARQYCVAFYVVLAFVSVRALYTECFDSYCLSVLSPRGNGNLSLVEANSRCHEVNESKLLEITDERIYNNTVQFIRRIEVSGQGLVNNPVIINAFRNDGSWFWINGERADELFPSETFEDYENFTSHLQRSGNNISVASSNPSAVRSFICQYTKTSYRNYTFESSDNYYLVFESKSTWFDARNRCLRDGGDLATFNNLYNDVALTDLLKMNLRDSEGRTYWVGLRKSCWINSDHPSAPCGSWMVAVNPFEIRYSNWLPGNPKNSIKRCVCLRPVDWLWTECDCSGLGSYYQFICITPISETGTTSHSAIFNEISSSKSPNEMITRGGSGFPIQFLPGTSNSNSSTISSLMEPAMNDHAYINKKLALGLGLGLGLGVIVIGIVVAVAVVKGKQHLRRHRDRKAVSVSANDEASKSHEVTEPANDDNGRPPDNTDFNAPRYESLVIPSSNNFLDSNSIHQNVDYEPLRRTETKHTDI